MKRKILSLFFASVMVLCLFTACQPAPTEEGNEVPPVNVDGEGEASVPETENQGEEVENMDEVNVVELNEELVSRKEIPVDSIQKVLKMTLSTTGKAASKQIVINIDEITVPVGATLEYDVYLETDSVGLGVFDMRVGKTFLATNSAFVDHGGISLNIKDAYIGDYAYGRWYHRVFDLDITEPQPSKSIRFMVGGLYQGCTSVCYYDNICIKDADGNVIYTVDEDFVAAYDIPPSSDTTFTFEVVDDPAPMVGRFTVTDFPALSEPLGTVSGNDSVEAVFSIDDKNSLPALYVGDVDPSLPWGIRGYVFAVSENELILYRTGETITEVASKAILGRDMGKDISIGFELDGNVFSGYWLDDAEGVEPWPEFQLAIEDLSGKSFGVMDVYGRGCIAKSISFGKCEKTSSEAVYTNPVLHDFADPDVLLHDGVYYMYGTMGPGYKVYSSTDLVNWEYRGQCMENNFWGWENNGAYWAPDVEYYNGKFYMVCSINQHLGIAVADSPLGPFIADDSWIFEAFTIDGHLFIDDDGKAYLYYVTSAYGKDYGIYGVEIDLETLQVDLSTEKRIIACDEPWETYDRDDVVGESTVVEGPYMLKHNGKYYFTYSGSDYLSKKYAVGYAVSDSPLGDFVKYEGNPIHIGNANVYGTAHHAFTTSPDGSQLYIVYHQHKNANEVELRKISVDKARFVPTESGIDRLETYGPTSTPQKMPLE